MARPADRPALHRRLGVGWAASAASIDVGAVSAAMAADGRSFTVTVPGMGTFHSGFSARVLIDRKPQEFPSDAGTVVAPPMHLTEATPYGQAEVTETTIRFEKEQIDILFRLGSVLGVPGVLAQAGIRNAGKQPVNLSALRPAILAGQLDGNPADWLVSPLGEVDQPVQAVGDIVPLKFVAEYGGLYRRDKTGFLFGPVGTPIAYLNTRIAHRGNGNVTMTVSSQMTGVRVDPHELRWGQQVVLLSEKPQTALARWAEWVAKTHGARTSKGALSGWSSWYFLAGDVTGKEVLKVAETVLKSPDHLSPDVIQIDAGYEDPEGSNDANEKFPEGLAFYTQRIAATCARPGLAVRISTSAALSREAAWSDLTQRVRHAVQCGFTYLKTLASHSPFTVGTP